MNTHNATDKVVDWLEQPDVQPRVNELVRKWNELELLGIDLADQLRAMAEDAQTPESSLVLDEVEWSRLAERYAYDICGVTEEELTRRRIAAGGD